MALLHSVLGDSVHCGPCALSPLVGVPVSMWEDRAMDLMELERIASEASAFCGVCGDFERYSEPSGLKKRKGIF